MLYGIERTTDSEHRGTVIVKFSSLKRAQKWREESPGGLAWPDAADDSLPITQQNFHHRYREIYQMPKNWRMPTDRQLDRLRGSNYQIFYSELKVRCIRKDGEEMR